MHAKVCKPYKEVWEPYNKQKFAHHTISIATHIQI